MPMIHFLDRLESKHETQVFVVGEWVNSLRVWAKIQLLLSFNWDCDQVGGYCIDSIYSHEVCLCI